MYCVPLATCTETLRPNANFTRLCMPPFHVCTRVNLVMMVPEQYSFPTSWTAPIAFSLQTTDILCACTLSAYRDPSEVPELVVKKSPQSIHICKSDLKEDQLS